MPPKAKDTPKKAAPNIIRPPISESSLCYVPDDAIEGYLERIERCVEWSTAGSAIRHHQELCQREDIPRVTFSEALKAKIEGSILHGFLDKQSTLTLQEHWEIILPMNTWDNENAESEEAKICFQNKNNLTDNMIKAIKTAVRLNDRKLLMKQLRTTHVLRVTSSEMTEFDEGLKKFSHLVTLSLCGNYLSEMESKFLCHKLRILELQANRFSSLESFKDMPPDLLYIGLAKNLLTNDGLENMANFPRFLSVLDLSDNDIYNLEPLLDLLTMLPNLQSLQLAGNPCSVCAAYARTTFARLPRLKWLDNREILPTDRILDFEPHPADLRSTYFYFTIIRIISAPMPPKPEKGATATYHVELQLPLLDPIRRSFLMFRRYESLTELLPMPEDFDDGEASSKHTASSKFDSKTLSEEPEMSSEESDIFAHLEAKNSRIIQHYVVFESNRVPWNKIMNFQEPTLKIFCPDLTALRNTFRSTITLKLVYTLFTPPVKKQEKGAKSVPPMSAYKQTPPEQRVTIATIKCTLRNPDWSQPSQHFLWNETLNHSEAIHWGDGDLSVLQYQTNPVKVTKGKQEQDVASQRQIIPEILTCHFGFGIETQV